jgi:hypothetical protein
LSFGSLSFHNGNPPETQQALERFLAAGYWRKQAVALIGSALVEEIWAILHDHEPFERAVLATWIICSNTSASDMAFSLTSPPFNV